MKNGRCITSRYRYVLRWLFAAVALAGHALIVPAHATTWTKETGWKLEPGSDGIYSALPDTRPGQPHTTACTSTGCSRSGSLPTRYGSPPASVKPTASFPLGSIAKGVLGLSNLAAAYNAGYALGEWLRDAGVRPADDGGFETQDAPAGQGENGYGLGVWNANNQPANRPGYPTPEAACRDHLPWVVPTWTFLHYDYSGGVCVARAPDGFTAGVLNVSKIATCPFGQPDASGRCPYTSEWRKALAEQALQKLVDKAPSPEQLSNILRETLEQGGSVEDTGVHTLSGPASVEGPKSTKTVQRPDGTVAVSITNTTHNITYNNNSMTVTTTSKTTNPDGTTEETTTTPERTECEKNPGAASCQELGRAEDQALKTDTKDISLTPVAFSENGSCPAPVTFTVYGAARSFSFDPVCEQASGVIRAVVLLAAGFVAAWIFVDGLKS